ncbi:hypothetical protein CMEL01_04537 [Colletotrichum melonis]|uniref:Uncharacterized protein n=1 Tax=Colletotrichum melonis TaxID=1209925 RepID=A0AAI9UEH2_9PEZI|nr:hypothetical protein CMEL01_04537 [Colletotrichum melonis]
MASWSFTDAACSLEAVRFFSRQPDRQRASPSSQYLIGIPHRDGTRQPVAPLLIFSSKELYRECSRLSGKWQTRQKTVTPNKSFRRGADQGGTFSNSAITKPLTKETAP